jgi:serine/threonine-protein kinase
MLGTPAFMAPEQALAEPTKVGAHTDVWAVGATIFTLVSGTYVHDGANARQVLVRAAVAHAPALSSVASKVPPEVDAIVARALAYDPEARWPSAAAMRDEVARAHEALFGGRPEPDALRALLEPPPAHAPSSGPDVVALAKTENSSPPGPPATRVSAPTPAGTTTVHPVSTRPAPHGSRRPWIAAGVAAVLGTLGIVLALLLQRGAAVQPSLASAPPASAPDAPVAAEEPATAPVASTPPSPRAQGPSPSALPEATPAGSANAPDVGPAASAPSATRRPAPGGVASSHARAAVPSTVASARSPAPSSAPSSARNPLQIQLE